MTQTTTDILTSVADAIEANPTILADSVYDAKGEGSFPTHPEAVQFDVIGRIANEVYGTDPVADEEFHVTLTMLQMFGVKDDTPRATLFFDSLTALKDGATEILGVEVPNDEEGGKLLTGWLKDNGTDPVAVVDLLRKSA